MQNDDSYWRHNIDGAPAQGWPASQDVHIGIETHPDATVGAEPADPAACTDGAPETAAPTACAANQTVGVHLDAPAGSQPQTGYASAQSGPQPAPGYAPHQQPLFGQQPIAYAPVQPAYGAASAPAPKSYTWLIPIFIVIALVVITLYSINSCTNAVNVFYGNKNASALKSLAGDAVGVINISGTIQYDNTACSPEGLKTLLDRAEKNSHVKAVVLRVDSGGGTATAGEEMAEYVRRFTKPVVVSSASINASAAYEISSQADYIYVAKSTEIGAIGTAIELMDLSGLLDMLGISMETITSSDSKDSSYGYRALTEEERAYYQDMIDQVNEVFIENVAEGRKMEIEEVRKLATGMPFTGVTAIENGLADEVGTREDAVAKAAELGGITGTYETVTIDFDYGYDLSDLALLLGSNRTDISVEDLAAVLGSADTGSHMK